MIPVETITWDGDTLQYYKTGIRADYYVSRRGAVYSRSHTSHKIKKLTPDTNRLYPTIRYNVWEAGAKVRYNKPLYRIMCETFIDPNIDWSTKRVDYINGNRYDCSLGNLSIGTMSSKILPVVLDGLQRRVRDYSLFDSAVRYVSYCSKLSLDICEDIVQETFIRAAATYDGENFANYWFGAARKAANRAFKRWHAKKSMFEENDFETLPHLPHCISWLKCESLTKEERFWLNLLLKGFTRQDIMEVYNIPNGRKTVRLKSIFSKLKETYI